LQTIGWDHVIKPCWFWCKNTGKSKTCFKVWQYRSVFSNSVYVSRLWFW